GEELALFRGCDAQSLCELLEIVAQPVERPPRQVVACFRRESSGVLPETGDRECGAVGGGEAVRIRGAPEFELGCQRSVSGKGVGVERRGASEEFPIVAEACRILRLERVSRRRFTAQDGPETILVGQDALPLAPILRIAVAR